MNLPIKNLEGRPHFVVPVVMIVEGVLCGSAGSMLYARAELKRSVDYWNGRPVVVYHPDQYGMSYAGHPDVFSRQRIGTVFNANLDGGRLRAEAWLDIERTELVDPRVLDAVKSSTMMEVSTGLYADQEDDPGTFHGIRYHAVARNLRPDHLAILPDRVGACSIADGAGLVRNLGEEALLLPVMEF